MHQCFTWSPREQAARFLACLCVSGWWRALQQTAVAVIALSWFMVHDSSWWAFGFCSLLLLLRDFGARVRNLVRRASWINRPGLAPRTISTAERKALRHRSPENSIRTHLSRFRDPTLFQPVPSHPQRTFEGHKSFLTLCVGHHYK